LIKIQLKKETIPLKVKATTPGKKRINSKSNNTNKIAKKKKGALIEKEETSLSNPDSRGVRLSNFILLLFERIT